VKLEFKDGALEEVAKLAIKRKTGARGLRSILENAMLDVMYEIPSLTGCKSCTIGPETITKGQKPELNFESPTALANGGKKEIA
jgi:ATP-dependent Clp protease ATP-binding subunit ClpX